MQNFYQRINLQLFAGEGTGDGGGETASPVGTAPLDDGEARLKELGVPESALAKHRESRKKAFAAMPKQNVQQAAAAPETEKQTPTAATTTPDAGNGETNTGNEAPAADGKMSFDDFMAIPENNKQMQTIIQSRLKSAKGAEDTLQKLTPVIELLARKHGFDMKDIKDLDVDGFVKTVTDDNSYYEDKALELGVPVETAKKIDQDERENARRQEQTTNELQRQMFEQHIASLQRQGEELKKVFPNFDLAVELRNPTFARMTGPNGGVSVEDAYYAVHRKEIQSAAMKATAENTARQIAASIRSGQQRPVENGTSSASPSTASFDYAHATKEQREDLKRRIYLARARGEKIYPGQE